MWPAYSVNKNGVNIVLLFLELIRFYSKLILLWITQQTSFQSVANDTFVPLNLALGLKLLCYSFKPFFQACFNTVEQSERDQHFVIEPVLDVYQT